MVAALQRPYADFTWRRCSEFADKSAAAGSFGSVCAEVAAIDA
jgi:hypothetical protein